MRRIWAMALTLALLLTSCAAMLERERTVTSPHQKDVPARGDAAFRVETYPALQAALAAYVEEGMDRGLLHFPTTYAGNLTVDLEKAKRYIMEQDPLGSFALEGLEFQISRIISYYEVALEFTYNGRREDLAALTRVGSEGQLCQLFAQMLLEAERRRVVELTVYPEPEGDSFSAALDAAYDQNPGCALGKPELSVELFPETGPRRVAIIELDYPLSFYLLQRRQTQLAQAAEEWAAEWDGAPEGLFALLRDRCTYDPLGGSTAYDALTVRRADDEGLCRAFLLLYDGPAALARRGGRCYIHLTSRPGGGVYLDLTRGEYVLLEEMPEEPLDADRAEAEEPDEMAGD